MPAPRVVPGTLRQSQSGAKIGSNGNRSHHHRTHTSICLAGALAVAGHGWSTAQAEAHPLGPRGGRSRWLPCLEPQHSSHDVACFRSLAGPRMLGAGICARGSKRADKNGSSSDASRRLGICLLCNLAAARLLHASFCCSIWPRYLGWLCPFTRNRSEFCRSKPFCLHRGENSHRLHSAIHDCSGA